MIAMPRRDEWLRQVKDFRREQYERQASFSSTLKEEKEVSVRAIPPPAGGTPAAPPSATAPAPQPDPLSLGLQPQREEDEPSGLVVGGDAAGFGGGTIGYGEDDGAVDVHADSGSGGDPDELSSLADNLGTHALADLPKMTMPLRNSGPGGSGRRRGSGSRLSRTISDQPPTLSSLAC